MFLRKFVNPKSPYFLPMPIKPFALYNSRKLSEYTDNTDGCNKFGCIQLEASLFI